MELEVRTIKGPPTDKVSRQEAQQKLAGIGLPEGSIVGELRDIEGLWVVSAAIPKKATPPPFEPQEEAPPGDSPEGPPSDDGGEGGPPPDDGGEEKPEGDEKGDDKGKGVEHQVAQLTHMLTTLLTALGLDPTGGGLPGPEGDVGPTPPGPGGPPDVDQAGGDAKTHTVHERALKPGESPPGTTPIGSPAFASVSDEHPWVDVIGKKRTFLVESPIGDRTMSSVKDELNKLAEGTGYGLRRAKEGIDKEGRRVARALIQLDS